MSHNDFVLTDYARKLVHFKACQLCRLYNFNTSDEEELEQELWLAVVARASKFDRERASLNTFIACIVNSTAITILRNWQQQKRINGFPTMFPDRPEPIDEIDRHETVEAVKVALAKMPDRLRDICQHVMHNGISSAAHEMKISRRQIRNALVAARRFLKTVGVDSG